MEFRPGKYKNKCGSGVKHVWHSIDVYKWKAHPINRSMNSRLLEQVKRCLWRADAEHWTQQTLSLGREFPFDIVSILLVVCDQSECSYAADAQQVRTRQHLAEFVQNGKQRGISRAGPVHSANCLIFDCCCGWWVRGCGNRWTRWCVLYKFDVILIERDCNFLGVFFTVFEIAQLEC